MLAESKSRRLGSQGAAGGPEATPLNFCAVSAEMWGGLDQVLPDAAFVSLWVPAPGPVCFPLLPPQQVRP